MSTSYYPTRPPVSSVRVEEGPGHDEVHVWERGAKVGTLTVTKGYGRVFAAMFFATQDDPVVVTWSLGRGKMGLSDRIDQTENCCLMDSYGEITWLEDVRKRVKG